MSLLILVPALFCIVVLVREGTQPAFFKVCIPTILLFPTYYFWKVPLLPPFDVAKSVMVPLGVGMCFSNLSSWRLSRVDLWIVLFVLSAGFAEYRVGTFSASIIAIFTQMSGALFPYMAGKLLVEQHGFRVATAKRFVTLLFVVSIISTYEYWAKVNPFRQFWSIFFPFDTGWFTQTRWGFGRIAGPYAQSELAGMILLIGILLTLWLSYWGYWELRFRGLRFLPLKKSVAIASTLFVCLFMTQARGPWLGTIVASAIAIIGRSKRVLRTALIVGCVGLVIGLPGFIAAKRYLDAPTSSDEQQTAQYRQLLWTNYVPIARMGGIWGWGQDFPKVYLQPSIDNQYLFAWITQGLLGGVLFILLILDPSIGLVRAGLAAQARRDRHFLFSLLGIIAGISVTLATVYLGEQTFEIFFLLLGWSQAAPFGAIAKQSKAEPAMLRVYT
jgi:hypothetical protein